jgi:zinc protease
VVDSGHASDPSDGAGTAMLATSLLTRGTTRHDAFVLADRRDLLGATLGSGSALDLSYVWMTALGPNLDPSLALFAEVLQTPAFATEMVALERSHQLAAIARQQASPDGIATRLTPIVLYGDGHPYARPGDGLGHAESVAALDADALRDWHRRHFVPTNATLIVAGAVDAPSLRRLLERHLGSWQGEPPAPLTIPASQAVEPGRILLVDRPGASQSTIIAAHLTAADGVDPLALETVLRGYGGMATSRLNRNLRLDKHWSYGARGYLQETRGPDLFVTLAPVQTDRTGDAMRELRSEIIDIAGRRPVAGEELDSLLRSQVSRLPGRFETLAALLGAGTDLVMHGRDPAYYYDYARNVRALDGEALNAAAAAVVDPDALVWIVIGDLRQVRSQIEALGWGEPTLLEAAAF